MLSIYSKSPNPKNGEYYIDSNTGQIFVYLAGNWVNTYLSNSLPLASYTDNSFTCRGESFCMMVESKIKELGLVSIKKSRSMGTYLYTIEDSGEAAVFKLYFNEMISGYK